MKYVILHLLKYIARKSEIYFPKIVHSIQSGGLQPSQPPPARTPMAKGILVFRISPVTQILVQKQISLHFQ